MAARGLTITKALVVRVMLFLHVALTTWRVAVMRNDDTFWLLMFGTVFMVLEASYTIYRRNGVEPKWFCPCFLAYLAATLPGIWLLEISRTANFGAINTTAAEDITIAGIHIPIRLQQDTWVLIVEESLLYLMIIARWFLPRGKVTREQLSELLFALIGIASDIMELFSLFDEDVVRHNDIFTYALLGVWSLSVLQFCLVLTSAERPRRAENVGKSRRVLSTQEQYRLMVRVELAAVLISLFMQDGPFLALRLVVMIHYDLVTYDLVFYSAKNCLVILLLMYRLMVMCSSGVCGKRWLELDGEVAPDMELEVTSDEAEKSKVKNVDKKGDGSSLRRRHKPRSGKVDPSESRDIESFIEETMGRALDEAGDAGLPAQTAGAPTGNGIQKGASPSEAPARASSDSQLAPKPEANAISASLPLLQQSSLEESQETIPTPSPDSSVSPARSTPLLIIPAIGAAPLVNTKGGEASRSSIGKLVSTINVKL